MGEPDDADLQWRVSSFTQEQGTCVEVAVLPNGHVAVRNSNDRAAGIASFTRAEMTIWIKACKSGEFDDLAEP